MLFQFIDSRYVIDYNINVHDITRWFKQQARFPEVSMFEFGIDNVRFDLIKINCSRRWIRIFEFKTSRRNFVQDTKWKKYIKYCHTLTFVCPQGIIDRKELPQGVGLLNVFHWKHRNTGKYRLGGMWIKRPRTIGKPTNQMLMHIAFRAISKFPHREYW